MMLSLSEATEKLIAPALRKQGFEFVGPVWLGSKFFAKGKLLLVLSDPLKDQASISLGVQKENIDPRFVDFDSYWWQSNQRPYESWLSEIKYDLTEFKKSLGGFESGGFRAPDFEALAAIIADTLPKLERRASNL